MSATGLDGDALRLLAVCKVMDGIGTVDFHERSAELAEQRGHEEPTDADYLDAVREGLDVIVKEEFGQ
jgi:hypothetical protein